MTKWKGKAASFAPNFSHCVSAAPRAAVGRILTATLLLALVASSASAADRYWDPNGTAANRGGTGTWDTSASFWSPNGDGVSGPYGAWSNGALDDAFFGGATAATVNLGVPITVHNLTFDASTTYTLTGSTLTLGGATPTITTNGTATVNSMIAGSAGLTKAGAGALNLTGANTFAGGINISAGTLNVSGDSSLGAASNTINLSSGAILRSTGALASSRVVTLLSGSSYIGGGVGSAHITGSGGLSLVAQTTLNDDTNDFTGPVGTDGSHLIFTSIRNLGETSALGAATTAANGAVYVRNASAIYIGSGDTSNRGWSMAPFTGSSALRNQGSGTLTVTGDITAGGGYAASVILDAQTADLALLGVISSNLPARPFIFMGGGTNRNITLNSANTFGGAVTIQSVTVRASSLANQGTGSSLGTGAGAATISLANGALAYTGTGGGTNRGLWLNGANSVLNDGNGALALSGTVAFNAAAPVDSLTLGGSFTGNNTLSGVLSGNGGVIMNGAAGNVWLLSGTNSYNGATTVVGGTLQAGSDQAFGAPNAVTVNGGTLDLNTHDITVTSLGGTGGSVALNGGDLTVNGAASTSYAGSITGNGSLLKRGTGTLTLTGQNSYTGGTTINGGTLGLNFAAAGAPASNILSSASTLNMAGGTLTLVGASGVSNSQTFNGLNVAAGNNRIIATSGAGGSMTLNLGALTHSGGLTDFTLPTSGAITTTNGDGALGWATVNGTDHAQVLAGTITAFTSYANKDDASTWLTGDVVSDAGGAANTAFFNTVTGNVQLGGLKYTAATNSTVTIGGGNTLGVGGTIILASSVGNASQTITGGTLTGGAGGSPFGALHNGTGTGTFTIASTIVNNGGATSFIKGGTGKVALTGANTYAGGTTLSGGTLAIASVANAGVASSIGASTADSANLVIESGTLEYTGIGAGTTDRGFTLTNGGPSRTIQVNNSGANLTFGGVVVGSDDASLIKTGAGTLTLANAANIFTGVTTVSAGTLSVNTLANGGVASGLGASTADSTNLVLQSTGGLQYTGGTASTDRGFTLGTGNGRIDVSNAATALTMSGVATGAGGLVKQGAGTLVLSGTNLYQGGTTVSAGTLRAGSVQAFGNQTALMDVATGATLDLAGFSNTVGALNGAGNVILGSATLTSGGANGIFTGTISGSGAFTRMGGGTQAITGCNNSYTGATAVNGGGTLSVNCLANGGLASGIGASGSASSNLVLTGGTLAYTGTNVTTNRGFTLGGGDGSISVSSGTTTLGFTGQVTGAGRLRKFGPGTLALSGTNNYSGGTVVDAGTLRAGSASAFGTGGMAFNSADATLDLAGNNNSVLNLQSVAGPGHVLLGGATLTITNGSNLNYSGTIEGTGNVVKSGGPGAAQVLAGCNSSYTGSTTVASGWLQVACLSNGSINSSIGASTSGAGNLVLNGGTLQYIGAAGSTDRQFTLGSSGGGLDASGTGAINFTSTAPVALTGSGSRTLTLAGSNTGDNRLSARLDDPAGGTTALTKTGTGTWILNNPSSTYTGITTINGGVLGVDKLSNGGLASSVGASSAAASNLVIGNGSTLRYTGAGDTTNRLFTLSAGTTFVESSGTGAVVFTDTGPVTLAGLNQARTIALGGTNTGNNTLAGSIGNAGTGVTTLAKNDSGTWVLTGNNTFTGNTVINNGNLMVGNGGTSGNAGAGNVIVNSPTSTLSFNRSDSFNFTGTLSGPGSIAQVGTGTTVLTAAGNAIGATSISAGTLQVNGDLTTSTIAINGAGTLTVNGTVQGPAAATSTITGDAGSSTIIVHAGGTLRANGDLGAGNDVVNVGGTLNTGAATLNLGAGNDTLALNDTAVFGGTGVNAGTGGETGAGDTLQVINNAARTLDGGYVSGFENLNKQGTATLTLTGNHSYSGGTTISAGTLQVGNGVVAGGLTTPTVANNGTLAFNLNSDYAFAGVISGTGSVNKLGSGTTRLTGANTYSGATNVTTGTLFVDGNQSGASGPTNVSATGTLGGTGIIGGSVTIADGGTLSPGDLGNAPGTLTINGNLALGNSNLNINFGQANVPGGPFNDLINVGGNLSLDGTLNVSQTPGGTFGPGVYRVFTYGGTLADNGLDVTDPDYFVQTSVANQVNLVNSAGLELSYWDGDAGPHSNGAVNGGNGTWRAAGDQNWTDSSGIFAAPFANGSFAIFQGTAGTVTVYDAGGSVAALGMQFASNGYVVNGDGIALVDDSTQAGLQSVIRVGDGTSASAGYVATISSDLSGATQLVKTDLGTLVLSGSNTYTSGTAVNGGIVDISADANLGAAAGTLSLDSGTLRNTAAVVSNRTVTIASAGGTFNTLDSLMLNGTIGGSGSLTKTGAGTLALTGSNTYQGGTVINGGVLSVSNNANLGDAAGGITLNGGTLNSTASFNSARSVLLNAGGGTLDTDNLTTLTLAGSISGTGALIKDGDGTLTLTNTNTYTGGTTIAAGTLRLGNAGAGGSINGDVTNNGTLIFSRNNTYSFAGLISGTGGIEQNGNGGINGGITVLTANNSYDGATNVREGTLIVNGNQSSANGDTTVEAGGVLGGTGTIGGHVTVQDFGALNPGDLASAPGTLTINGDLTLGTTASLNYNFGQGGVVGGAYNDLTVVHGDLLLDGQLNVAETAGGNFGPGIYRVISYDGTLTNLGLAGSSPNYVVQTSVEGQVNLVDISAMTLNFWDGDGGPKDNFLVDGGNGVWRAAGDDNWSDETGDINAAFSNGSFPIFAGAAGTVEVDNTNGQVQASGMQFATSGYLIEGDNITLVGPQSTIRVGDGTLPGAGYVATIGSVLLGSSQLVKSDLGTLVLTGANTYTGGTRVNAGTLQVASDGNLGDAAGGLNLDGGTLNNMAAFASARGVVLEAGGGILETDADLTLSGLVGGTGGLTKAGSAALILSGNNIYSGPTTVSAGGLYVDGDQSGATGPVSVQVGAGLGGNGVIGGDVAVADGATLSPGSANGTPGTLAISGNLALSSGSILNYSFGEANVPGGTLNDLTTVGGNLVLDGTLNVSVSTGGTFGPGIYRVFSYNGALTNNGLSVGSIPSTNYFVQTAIANQVNLVNAQGLTLNYWDGAAGPKFDGVVNGGDGIWQSASGNDSWADATGIINAPFSDGSFAIFAGAPGKVTVENGPGQVTASGMQFTTDGYLIQGGSIALDGGATSTIRVGDGTSAGADITATIASQFSGNTQLVKTDRGTLVLTGTNSYSGGTAINGGTLQVSTNANLGDAAGALSFNGGTLHTTASFISRRNIDLLGQGTFLTDDATTLTLDGTLSGSGSFVKSGTGKMVLASDGSGFAGVTSIDGGTLAVNGSLCGEVNVRSSARLQGTGTVCDTNNFDGGTIAPGNSIGTLTVAGDYAGSGGTLEIETVLGGDASPTDRLVVSGNTAGTTRVKVINLDGGGAQTQNGIEVVDVGGASNGSFSLAGDYVFDGEQAAVGGAYAYRLYKNGISTPNDGDWYLRSTYLSPDNPAPQPLYAPGLPLYEAYAGVLQSFNELGTLQQRVGNRTWGEGATPQGADVPGQGPVDGKAIWARIQAAHSQLDPDVSTTAADYDVSTWKLQAGLDGLLHEGGAGMLIGGLTVHYGTVSADVSSLFGNGSIDATGYGFGGTLTWYGNNGLYIDAQAEATWYDSDIRSATLGSTLANGNDGFGYALSIEAGQKIALDGNWSLTPQAQLAYSAVDFVDFTDPYGAGVALGNSDGLIGRLGLSVDYESQWANAAGQASRSHVYGIANLYYDFLDGSDVNVSGVSLVSQNQALWGGLGLGGSISWADSRYTLYGEAIARGSFEDMSDNNAISAKVGFSVNW
ncbi:autotransporter-associated beta strand repeat-containing protein [Phyllobacterium endophyticum]|nr:autotransporter-associated beta strand repeat-containing protein [Phyllobacterium endophyticum]MBB3237327.1 fibronectin-binding autotransporter adhesin [Phyllobacterium endophyticum]TYR44325.1 autotransporter outer membrane beta-barrel domain-containing protein [Phyllobacterium endophyticum]